MRVSFYINSNYLIDRCENTHEAIISKEQFNKIQEIIKDINDNHIPTPSRYMKSFCNKKSSLVADKWNLKLLDYILKNKTYIGDSIQGKKTRVNHIKHNIVLVPEDEWIIIKNHHKAIIEEELFEQVPSIT